MSCFFPIPAYQCVVAKRALLFGGARPPGYVDIKVPCGQCVGCRLERSRQWAVRCMHEASLYDRNCFITLTYDDRSLPHGGTLVKKDFQDFMKRLRLRFPNDRVRYYHCGEYGSQFGRPHYHACLFGVDFPDKVQWAVRKGFVAWRSAILEELWTLGQSEIGSVTFESAAYVARYIMKKVTGARSGDHYSTLIEETGELCAILPEYTTMSRGGRGKLGGIGKPWFDKFGGEVYPADSVVVRGVEVKPPRYYDGLHELVNAPQALEVARARRRGRRLEDETPERLADRETCTRARLKRSERSLD